LQDLVTLSYLLRNIKENADMLFLSQVLGIGKDVSSGSYVVASVVAAAIGGYSTAQVQTFPPLHSLNFAHDSFSRIDRKLVRTSVDGSA